MQRNGNHSFKNSTILKYIIMKNFIQNLLLIAVTFVSTMACAADNVPYTLAKNYFVKNTYPEKNLHMLKITEGKKFDEVFGMAAVMGADGQPTPIDFSKSFVIALIDGTSNSSAGISVKSLVKDGDRLNLTYDFLTKESPGSASFRYCTILIVDKKYDAPVYANAASQGGIPMTGADMDDKGCKPSTGYSWSAIENECIQPWMTKYVFVGEIDNAPLIFSKDNKKAEIMMSSKFPKNLILTKKPKTRINTWVNGNLVLTQTKKNNLF